MNDLELLLHQTKDTYHWTNKLIDSIPMESWDTTPEVIQSNVSWQVGHLVVSIYFHSIWVIAGHQMEILRTIPLKEYDTLFVVGSPEDSAGKINQQQLMQHLITMQEKSISIISGLSSEQLQEVLEPTSVKHPTASTKLEAINWNIKHTMYHCGQLGMLKRVINGRFDFGLKR